MVEKRLLLLKPFLIHNEKSKTIPSFWIFFIVMYNECITHIGEGILKALYRILFVFALLLVVFFYTNTSVQENDVLKSPSKAFPEQTVSDSNTDAMPRPKEGYSTLIGQDVAQLKKKLGEPERIGPSEYDFDWWVYKQQESYILVGVEDDQVVQLFLAGDDVEAKPFTIGQTLEQLYRTTITDAEVHVKIKNSTYTFMLSELDLQSRLLVMYDGVYAQLYFDNIDGDLNAVRFLDGPTLVKMKPYDMSFVGDLLTPKTPSSFAQQKINTENATQLSELTNVFREHKNLPTLQTMSELNHLALEQSKVYAKTKSEDDEQIGLKNRLNDAQIKFKSASKNAAEDYTDAPEAIHGLMNSEKHRQTLLNDNFSYFGTGVFGKNYTQIFIEAEKE